HRHRKPSPDRGHKGSRAVFSPTPGQWSRTAFASRGEGGQWRDAALRSDQTSTYALQAPHSPQDTRHVGPARGSDGYASEPERSAREIRVRDDATGVSPNQTLSVRVFPESSIELGDQKECGSPKPTD